MSGGDGIPSPPAADAVQQRAVAAARRWLGTPYVHQASTLGVGTDCLGLIRGIWRDLYGREPEVVPAYTADWAEAGGVETLWAAAGRLMIPRPLGPPEPGNVVLFRMRPGAVAKHVGLCSAPGRFIHAYERTGVVETALTPSWARHIVARFDFPNM